MLWKRKPSITPSLPPRKEFETMLEILKDAEMFDATGEKKVANNVLKILVEYIDEFRSKNIN